jgi:hypothetical protein
METEGDLILDQTYFIFIFEKNQSQRVFEIQKTDLKIGLEIR